MIETGPAVGGLEIRISADSHVSEPPDLWEKRLPTRLRDRAPRFPGVEDERVSQHARAGGWDSTERLNDMAADGISAEVLYPTLANAIYLQARVDLKLVAAWDRVYNDWMVEFCQAAPDRLWGQAQIGLWNMDHAVQELERCKRAGLKGATIWMIPPEGLPFGSDHYERFWAAAQDLQMPVSMHLASGGGLYLRKEFGHRYRSRSHQFWTHRAVAMLTLAEVILSGVLERYPGLKLVLAECEVGWIPFWLEDLDRGVHGGSDPGLASLPSEYFNRQGYATFSNDGVGGYLLQRWGGDNFLFANDYPHPTSIWPCSDEVIARTLGDLTPEARARVLGQNVAKVYGVQMPAPLRRQPVPDKAKLRMPWFTGSDE